MGDVLCDDIMRERPKTVNLLFLSSSDENKKAELNRDVINKAQVQKPVGVHVDYKSKFDTHLETLRKIRGETFH